MNKKNAPLIRMENIHKWFGKVHAVDGISLTVDKGEIVGLVGNNGAGKSTLIKALVGVQPKNKGTYYWKGKEVEIKSIKDSRALGIEAVYQDQALVDSLGVVKNIYYGREPIKRFGPFKTIDFDKMKSEVAPLFDELGLDVASLDQEVRFCSGGERQGVAIVRAMLFRAKMVILDEPTTALSVPAIKRVLNFMKALKQEGISIILISHNIDHVYQVADRIAVISHGHKILDENTSENTKEEIEGVLHETAGAVYEEI
ncbi:sugar ABC transporter ATP-binding protein [Candidatus Bipolaricaulota bacterium]|nr:sugar ABC transporter ATP-binding protein [Candidatus Bipolaricaulota bacterium]